MYESMMKAIRFCRDYAESGDLESFSFHSNNAKLIASGISFDAYLVASLAIHSILDDLKIKVVSDNHGKNTKISEYSDIHTWVRLSSGMGFIEGYKLDSGRVPDFVSVEQGKHYPVECKIKFNSKSLNQLRTYMVEMGVSKGYAVAVTLDVELPENIEFIEVPL